MSSNDEGYTVVDNTHRDPKTGRVVATSFWVCGPAGFLQGPFGEREAQALARRLNRGAQPQRKQHPQS